MDDAVPDVITAVCRLPLDIARGNVSESELMRRSGYRRAREAVTIEMLRDQFDRHPELGTAWIEHSEGNRGLPAWYVTDRDTGSWEVGFVHGNGRRENVQSFADRSLACATFLKATLEAWASSRIWWL